MLKKPSYVYSNHNSEKKIIHGIDPAGNQFTLVKVMTDVNVMTSYFVEDFFDKPRTPAVQVSTRTYNDADLIQQMESQFGFDFDMEHVSRYDFQQFMTQTGSHKIEYEVQNEDYTYPEHGEGCKKGIFSSCKNCLDEFYKWKAEAKF